MTKSQGVPQLLGARLRQARLGRGLTLHEVESLTGGAIKAAVLSAYELGDKSISALRLGQLAELYRVSPAELIPSTTSDEAAPPDEPGRAVASEVHLDLGKLAGAKGRDVELVRRLVDSIGHRRSTRAGRYFAVRHDDLEAMAAVMGRSVEQIVASLDGAGVLRRPPGRPRRQNA